MKKAHEKTKFANFYEEEYNEIEEAIEKQRRQAQKNAGTKVEDIVKSLLETGKKVETENAVENNKIEVIIDAPQAKGDEKIECKREECLVIDFRFVCSQQDGFLGDQSCSRRTERKRNKNVDFPLMNKLS